MNLLMKLTLRKLRNNIKKATGKQPDKLAIKAHYEKNILHGEAIFPDGTTVVNNLSLKENSEFTDMVFAQLKGNLSYDEIKAIFVNVDFLIPEIASEVYYLLNGEKQIYKTKD